MAILKGPDQMTGADLQETHPYHTKFLQDWKLRIAAYEGTQGLLSIGALAKHQRESDDNYQARMDEAYSFEYSKAVVNLFHCFLFEKEPTRDMKDMANDEIWQSFVEDCDLMGTPFYQYIKENQKYASVCGHVGILVNKPTVSVQTRAEELANGVRPYLSAYLPHNILDWRIERDENHHPFLAYLKLLDEDGLYHLWTPDEWEVWEHGEKKPNQKVGNVKATLVRHGVNPLKVIPFIWLLNGKTRYSLIGASDIGGVARIDAAIMRDNSHGQEVIKFGAFPMLRLPMSPAVDDDEEQDEDVGVTAVLEFDPKDGSDGKPDWLESKVLEPIEAILKWTERNIQEIYRSANAGGASAVETTTAKSGYALKMEFQQLNAQITAKALGCEKAELEIIRFFRMWQGMGDFGGSVEWPREFSIDDLATALQDALTAKTVVGSVEFNKVLAKRIVRNIMPYLDDKEYAAIDKDIDAGQIPVPEIGDKPDPDDGEDEE